MLQFDEYKVKLNNLKPALDHLGDALDLEGAGRELDELHARSAAPGFWDDVDKAQKIQQHISRLEAKVDGQKKRVGQWEDLLTLVLAQGACFSLRQLAVKGNDLTALGLHGPAVGRALNELLELVIDEKLPNERGMLLEYVKEKLL